VIFRRIFILAFLTIPLTILLPGLNDFVYPLGSQYSDLTISHYPNLIFLRQSLAAGDGIPLWSNTILSGYPFAANPLSGLWYPPGWLLVVLPLPIGFNFLVMLHMLWGGLGMYLLLRQRQIQLLPALMGALTFELFPKVFAHFGAGHITLLFAVAWTPWLLLAEHLQDFRPGRRIHLLPALVLGVILIADVRWGLYAVILWFFYSMDLVFPDGYSGRTLVKWIKATAIQVLAAGLIAAPLLLLLLEYTRLSTRHILTADESLILALPPSSLLGLLFPDLAAYAEWVVYPGALAILLSVWIVTTPVLRERCRFWVVSLVLIMLIALGPNVPIIGTVLKYIVRLPFLNLLRVPTRSIFILGIGFAILLAEGLQYLLNYRKTEPVKKRFGPGLVVVAITAFSVLLAAGAMIVTQAFSIEFMWGAVALTIFCLLLLLRQAEKLSGKAWLLILLPLLVLDIAGVGYFQLKFRDQQSVLGEGIRVGEYLSAREGLFRVYSPSYSLPQQTAALAGLQLADGVDPLILLTYAKYMDRATGVPREGYSVTLPSLESDDIHLANQDYQPDAASLGLLNIRYVVAEFPLAVDGLNLVERIESTWIYENLYALPRAWVQNDKDPLGVNIQHVRRLRIQPNKIELTASGPGMLILSELNYPGWQVRVNGEKSKIVPVMDLLRGVELTELDNNVEFVFRPVVLSIGLVLSIFTLMLALLSLRKVPVAE
jgi:hypothetical protein